MNYRLEELIMAKQKALLVSKIHIYDDKFIDYKLNENCFTGYYKLIARAITKIQEEQGFIDEVYLVEFLVKNNCFNETLFLEILITTNIPYSVALIYERDLKKHFKGIKLI